MDMITKFEEAVLTMIDARIKTASDDELFAGGYLRGHISLSTASCEEDGINDVNELKLRVEQSLANARTELSPADSLLVLALWEQLKQAIQ